MIYRDSKYRAVFDGRAWQVEYADDEGSRHVVAQGIASTPDAARIAIKRAVCRHRATTHSFSTSHPQGGACNA